MLSLPPFPIEQRFLFPFGLRLLRLGSINGSGISIIAFPPLKLLKLFIVCCQLCLIPHSYIGDFIMLHKNIVGFFPPYSISCYHEFH